MTHTQHDYYDTLFPILALSISIILSILVIRSYHQTQQLTPTVILPAGGTYVGQ